MVQVDVAIGIATATTTRAIGAHGVGSVSSTGWDAIGIVNTIHALQGTTAVITKLVGTRTRLAGGSTGTIIIVVLEVGVAGITSTSTITKIAITSVFVYPINAGAVIAIHTIALIDIGAAIGAAVAIQATTGITVNTIHTGAAIFA